ncbi:MAG: DUF3990 domain-containing protein [Oscillospiraceae bacterium]|nr:DUF3990 domain-containing protein [Oscillospiraceae bacterium]
MPELKNQMLLYHGSYCEVRWPDLAKCAKYKDFGQGFYLTSSLKQAQSFAKISTRKARENGVTAPAQKFGIVSSFRYDRKNDLKILDYPSADTEWLHCIVGHRKKNTFPDLVKQLKPYDIISGKIANDDTNATIAAYMQGVFGELGTENADGICIQLLLPERLQDQFCFRTERALETLTWQGSDTIWL